MWQNTRTDRDRTPRLGETVRSEKARGYYMLSPKSIPDVTPPAVTILPSLTMRAFLWVALTSGSNSVNAQCVVARRPLSNPAAPRIKAPAHTEVTYFAEVDCLRINSIVSRSPIT